jgi:hypothetical protein
MVVRGAREMVFKGKAMRSSVPLLMLGLLAACGEPAYLQPQSGFGAGATGYTAASPYAAVPAQVPATEAIPSSEINSALFGTASPPAGAASAPAVAPVLNQPATGAVAIAPGAQVPTVGVSDEQDFSAVSSRETIESDKARIEANKAKYQQIAPAALPERTAETVSPVVTYVLSATNRLGEPIYERRAYRAGAHEAACQRFATGEAAQQAFLAAGGPSRDRKKLDPDGDGYACDFDPTPFQQGVGN